MPSDSMLLHTCCGPCACYSTEHIAKAGIAPTLFFYNPNIHPYQEFLQRREGLRQLAAIRNLPLIEESGYAMEDFLANVAADPARRCEFCYRNRLTRTAVKAQEMGFGLFGTTLLISPYQNRDRLVSIGRELAQEKGLEFYDEDLRPGFRQSQAIAKELGLYRQKYCGCIYSEKERYYKE
jgi:predicted adenine nucleotide alpha hydrolase (AANH) superfamily ATPase